MHSHRLIAPDRIDVHSFEQPFSCFEFVDRDFAGTPSIHRIFSLARSHEAKTLTIEQISPAGLIADENAEILAYHPDFRPGKLFRLAFWKPEFSRAEEAGSCRDTDLVSYAILKEDFSPSGKVKGWHVFEAVVRKYDHRHNCVPHQPTYTVGVNGREFAIPGILYCQQNTLNKVCAHVALRSVLCRHLPDGDIAYRRINELARNLDPPAFNLKHGLTVMQIRAVLDGFGIAYRDIDYAESSRTSPDIRKTHLYQKFVYSGVESGAGALLGFRLTGPGITGSPKHIIPFHGHTFNKDTWVPDADISYFNVGAGVGYIPSESWTSSFLGHDDNFGANFCVPRLYIQPDQAEYVVELLNNGYAYSGVQAEAMALPVIYSMYPHLQQSGNPWVGRLAEYAHPHVQKVVLRAVAVTKARYLDHLENESDWEGKTEHKDLLAPLRQLLPDNLWCVELSIPQLFPANERKLGEVVLDGSRSIGSPKGIDFSLFCLARLPGMYLLIKTAGKNGQVFYSVPSQIESHVPVIES
ncbi:MAG: hypothetical protein RRC34_14390 [Lentisphaeria bacterium]|nr:hypothetical protein [Lentisphaeria bacterium]